jgi:DNA-binding MarR family transcriptional regulator
MNRQLGKVIRPRGADLSRRKHLSERGKTKRAYQSYLELMEAAEWLGDVLERQLGSFELSLSEYRVMERILRCGPQYQQELSRRFRCSKQAVGWVIKRLEYLGCVVRLQVGSRSDSVSPRPADGDAPANRVDGGCGPSVAEAAEISAGFVGGSGWKKREREERLEARARGRAREKISGRVSVGADMEEFGRLPRPAVAGKRPVVFVQLTAEGRELTERVYLKHAKFVKALMRTLDGREQETLGRLCRKLRSGDLRRFCREMVWDRGERDRAFEVAGEE